MAKIVLIDTGTYREGINNIDDIASIYDDHVALTGPGYVHFRVMQVKGMSAAELTSLLQTKKPITDYAHKPPGTQKYVLGLPIEPDVPTIRVWKDPADGLWKFLEKEPKYPLNAADILTDDWLELSGDAASLDRKEELLDKTADTYAEIVENLKQVNELNK